MSAPATQPVERKSYSLKQLAIPVSLSVGVLGLVLWLTYEPGALRTMAAAFHPGYLLMAVAALGIQLLLGGLRMRHISHELVSIKNGMRAQLAWDFMSAITPSAIGGAPFASFFVAKDNDMPVGQATSVMLFSMLLDQLWFALTIPIILFATIQLDIFPPALGEIGAGSLTAYFLAMLAWVAFFAYATLIKPEIVEKIITWVTRFRLLHRFKHRVGEEMKRLKEQAEKLRGETPQFFLVGFFFSCGIWMCRYLVVLLIVLCVVPSLPAIDFLLRTGAMWITALIIPTPGGSGGIEGLYILFLAPLIPRVFVGPTLLTWRLLSYHLFIILGLFVTSETITQVIREKQDDNNTTDPSTPQLAE